LVFNSAEKGKNDLGFLLPTWRATCYESGISSGKMNPNQPLRGQIHRRAFTIVEVLVAVTIMGMAIAALMVATSSGLRTIKQAREDLRATQIMAQRLETIRLLTWKQLNDTKYFNTDIFTDYYDADKSTGTVYYGKCELLSCPYSVDYASSLKTVRITLTWTNGVLSTNGVRFPYAHFRTNDTLVCSNGLQSYIY
jgi:prepilin-type N-terminal cleavage/methylation domain-containing protein